MTHCCRAERVLGALLAEASYPSGHHQTPFARWTHFEHPAGLQVRRSLLHPLGKHQLVRELRLVVLLKHQLCRPSERNIVWANSNCKTTCKSMA